MIGDRRESGLVRRLLIPSFASAGVHALLLLGVLAATITITGRESPRPRLAEITADAPSAASPKSDPKPPPAATPSATPGAASTLARPTPPLTGRASQTADASAASPMPPSAGDALAAAEPEVARAVTFAGVEAQAARRIVYVVDASGSMVNSHAFVRSRLIHSINRLSPTQRFTIILARQHLDGPGVEVMPSEERDPLVRALPSHKAAAIDWVRGVVVGGRSAPLQGLEAALSLEPRPDLVFLLSRGFRRTDSGGAWAGVEGALAELDRLNPRSPRTGQRPVVVKTLQFLDDDPTGLMQAIGEAQGDGPGSFRVLTLDDLSGGDEDDPIVSGTVVDASIRRARTVLAEADGDALAVLYGLALPEARAGLEAAVAEARRALGPRLGEGDTAAAPMRARLDLLDAALSGDADRARAAAASLNEMFVVDAHADAARRLALAAARAMAGDAEAAGVVADAIEADAIALGLPSAILSELSVLRARFGLPGRTEVEPEWSLLLAEARVRRTLESAGPVSGAFEPLLAWGDDPGPRALADRRIADLTDALAPETALEPRVRFARAMGLAGARPGEAAEILLGLATGPLARESLWEAAVLLQQTQPVRAAEVLERFAAAYPGDARAPEALVAAVALTPDTDTSARVRRLRRALIATPGHADADRWRIQLARLLAPEESIVVLADIGPGSESAAMASDRVFEVFRSAAADRSVLSRCALLLRGWGDPRWQLVQADLVDLLIASDAAAAGEEAEQLDPEVPEFALLRARAQLASGRRDEGLRSLGRMTDRLGPDSTMYWSAWSLLLDTLSQDPAQADAVRAHVYRLRLIDPDFEAGRWPGVAGAVADAPSEP